MGTLRTIAILIIIYYIGKVLARYVFPLFLRNYIKNISTGVNNDQNIKKEQVKKEGEVTIDHKPDPKEKKVEKGEGDYVDFEEVE